jgi:hypothetical protein
MKSLKTILALTGLAASITLVASFSHKPVDTGAFSLLGHSLGSNQRDFRVFNNFTDSQANNNVTPHVNFPGATGAVMAIWKGHAEWGSDDWAGNGNGDNTQTNLGDGGSNYDAKFEGTATTTGGIGNNIHSELNGSSGGTLAFMQGGGNGWWVRYYSGWTWQDGPGSVGGGVDLQGVACHETGHAIGIGHSGSGGATMFPSISGTGQGQRSIANDDINAVKAVYGTLSGNKPVITGLSGGNQIGQTMTISGSGFSTASNNDVWFTKFGSNGVPVKRINIDATGGGTTLDVVIPSGIQDGDVMIQNKSIGGHAAMSNAFPFDVDDGGLSVPIITEFTPTAGPAAGWNEVVLTGINFTGATDVSFGASPCPSFTVDSDGQITCVAPPGALFSTAEISVTNGDGTGLSFTSYVYTFNFTIQIDSISPATGSTAGGTTVEISGPNVAPTTSVTFGGVAGTNLTITSATTMEVDTPSGSGTVDVVASGQGADTLPGAFTYTGGGPAGNFVNIGPGIAGTFGEPSYTGTGDLTPGSTLGGYSTTVSGAIPFNTGFLFLGLTENPVSFKGGLLYPFPIDAQVELPMDGTGSLTLPHTIPAGQGFEGLDIIVQWWFADGAAIKNASASNGLRLEIP